MMFLHVLLLFCAFPPSTAEGQLRQFYRLENKCSRDDAVKECRRKYTDLVTVYDQQDNIKLHNLIKNSYRSFWIGAYRGNRSKKWSNGDDVTYNKDFQMNLPETCCAVMKPDGGWESVQCTEKKPFMCYEQVVGTASYNYILILQEKTWFEAQLYCREIHTDLVSIRHEEENTLVKDAGNKSTTPFWIGLLEDSVEWKDGGRSAYRNWKSEHLQDQSTEAFMSFADGLWSKADQGRNYPLCYKSFIHVSTVEMSWEEAVDYCNNNPSSSGLLCIQSEPDHRETERELERRRISGPVWVGLRQSRLFGFWIWANGDEVGPWTNWIGGSPPGHQISHHCGALEKVEGRYQWCDKDCRKKFRVLCEEKCVMY